MTAHILQISAGVGPVEARRFVSRLAARLEARARALGLDVAEVVTRGAADAPRSIALHLRGDATAGLAAELGTHALIERSARRGRAARKRWFAAVTLHPAAAPPVARVAPPRAELIITACRAGGPGGQHVNKVSSAVRVQHVPSGLAVRSAGERSQQANLDLALARLAALLQDVAAARVAAAGAARRRAHVRLERGAAVRTYTIGADGDLLARSRP
ncbi:MAG: peptide chain release factor-like protein [Myxococcales bacterium]|nr:peptide chain release factor-like protein [Myxococcales bacterium]